jgi:DDE superfamily endonuclease
VRTTRVAPETAVPSLIVINLNSSEPARLREQMRRWHLLCPFLCLHTLLLLAQHRSPTEMAEWLLCSRSSVYEVAACWRQGWRPGWREETEQTTSGLALLPSLCRSLLARLRKPPRREGWCRTRGSGATLASSLAARRGWPVSAETVRRWWPSIGWRWKRAQLVAKDNDEQRASQWAQIRLPWETRRPRPALLLADELDIPLWPKTGHQWMPKGTQTEVLTPGQNEKCDLADGWDRRTGVVHHGCGPRQTNALFRDLLDTLELRYPARRSDRISVVVDNDKIHQAPAVQRWRAAHPRFQWLWLPTDGPRRPPPRTGLRQHAR